MQHDSHPVRIQVTEVHDGDVFDTIEEVTDRSCIPTGRSSRIEDAAATSTWNGVDGQFETWSRSR